MLRVIGGYKMNKNKILMVLVGILVISLSFGCVEQQIPTTITLPNSTQSGDVYTTTIEKEGDTTIITGRVVEIRFSSTSNAYDFLIFEDGVVYPMGGAEDTYWKLGCVYRINHNKINGNSLVQLLDENGNVVNETKTVPGFETLFLIVSIIGVWWLVKHKRK